MSYLISGWSLELENPSLNISIREIENLWTGLSIKICFGILKSFYNVTRWTKYFKSAAYSRKMSMFVVK